MFGKMICNECNGNGYIMIWRDASQISPAGNIQKEKFAIDCNTCNNQGEIEIGPEDLDLDKTPERTQ